MPKYSTDELTQIQALISQLEPGTDGHYHVGSANQRSDLIIFEPSDTLTYNNQRVVSIKLRYITPLLSDRGLQLELGPRSISYELKLCDANNAVSKVICHWPLPSLDQISDPRLHQNTLNAHLSQFLVVALNFYLYLNPSKETAKNPQTFFNEHLGDTYDHLYTEWTSTAPANQKEMMIYYHQHKLSLLPLLQHPQCSAAFARLLDQHPLSSVPLNLLTFRANYSAQSHTTCENRISPIDWANKSQDEMNTTAYPNSNGITRDSCNKLTFKKVATYLSEKFQGDQRPLLFVNFGCITGEVEQTLLQQLPEAWDVRFAGFDINQKSVSLAQQRHVDNSQIFFEQADAFKKNVELISKAAEHFRKRDGRKRVVISLLVTGILGDQTSGNTRNALKFMQQLYSASDHVVIASYDNPLVNKNMMKRCGFVTNALDIEWETPEQAGKILKLPNILALDHVNHEKNKLYIDHISNKRSGTRKTLDLSMHAQPIAYLEWLKQHDVDSFKQYVVIDLCCAHINTHEKDHLQTLLGGMPLLEIILVESFDTVKRLFNKKNPLIDKVAIREDYNAHPKEVPTLSRAYLTRFKGTEKRYNNFFGDNKPVSKEDPAAELLKTTRYKP